MAPHTHARGREGSLPLGSGFGVWKRLDGDGPWGSWEIGPSKDQPQSICPKQVQMAKAPPSSEGSDRWKGRRDQRGRSTISMSIYEPLVQPPETGFSVGATFRLDRSAFGFISV